MTTYYSPKFAAAWFRNALTLAIGAALITNTFAADSVLARVNGTDVKADEIRLPMHTSLQTHSLFFRRRFF